MLWTRGSLALVGVGLVVLVACAANPTPSGHGGTGGSSATGGHPGTGGAAGTGGQPGTGGTPSGTGGSGTGGSPAGTGGTPGTCSLPAMINGHQGAPNGYYVDGKTIYDAQGAAHLFHGVGRPSLEWSAGGEMIGTQDFMNIQSWKANVVRLSLNQDFWLSTAAQYAKTYPSFIQAIVSAVEGLGMDIILDLHWSDTGNLQIAKSAQQKMADDNSTTFWTQVATVFKCDGHVIFELYNEPHDVSPQIWQMGGMVDGWHSPGMQGLYNAVRATGAENLVIIGGLDWAFDLTPATSNAITGYNIAYASHPYGEDSDKQEGAWDNAFGNLSATAPVILTEFGTTSTCDGSYDSSVISYANGKGIGWIGYGWYVSGCAYPSLINDWSATPSASGTVVKAALAAASN